MDKGLFAYKRKSYMEIGELFFWTATINNWYHLLKEDRFKEVIILALVCGHKPGQWWFDNMPGFAFIPNFLSPMAKVHIFPNLQD